MLNGPLQTIMFPTTSELSLEALDVFQSRDTQVSGTKHLMQQYPDVSVSVK